MKKAIFILPILFFLGFNSIKANKEYQEPKKETLPKKVKYSLVIAFISKGNGIDNGIYEKIDNLIKNHPKKPAVTINRQGKEGEKTLYLKLNELDKKERKEFIKEVEKMTAGNDRILIQKDLTVKYMKGKL